MENINDSLPDSPMAELAGVARGIVESKAGMYSHLTQEERLQIGVCKSCLNSGLQHVMRNGISGVLADRNGVIYRCGCAHGNRRSATHE